MKGELVTREYGLKLVSEGRATMIGAMFYDGVHYIRIVRKR
jgi:hypothetical protein